MKINAGEIHLAIVAQSKRSFVENAEQQIPQRVAGFFDFIKEHEAELDGVRVILIQDFLA